MLESDKKKEIQNLLLVFGAAVGCALIGITYMLFSSSQANQYTLSNVLISPEVIQHLSAPPDHKHPSPVAFQSIQASFFNPTTRLWETKDISKESYQKLYTLIASDKSIEPPSDEVIDAFNRAPPVKFTILVEEKGSKQFTAAKNAFQEIDFASQGDFFRVELREEGNAPRQAYFYHPHIYKEVRQMVDGSV